MSTWTFNKDLFTQLSVITDISITKIAKRCNLRQQVLNRYVRGENELPLQTLILICNALHMPIYYFLSENGNHLFPTRETAIIAQEHWKPIVWDATAIDSIFGDGRILWKDVAKEMGVTPQKPRPRFLLRTRFPIKDFLDVCSKYELSPYTFLKDPNRLVSNQMTSSHVPRTEEPISLDAFYDEVAHVRADFFKMQRDVENLIYKYTVLLQFYERNKYYSNPINL